MSDYPCLRSWCTNRVPYANVFCSAKCKYPDEAEYLDRAHEAGAAVAFGLMGMAEAIRWKLCLGCGQWPCVHGEGNSTWCLLSDPETYREACTRCAGRGCEKCEET